MVSHFVLILVQIAILAASSIDLLEVLLELIDVVHGKHAVLGRGHSLGVFDLAGCPVDSDVRDAAPAFRHYAPDFFTVLVDASQLLAHVDVGFNRLLDPRVADLSCFLEGVVAVLVDRPLVSTGLAELLQLVLPLLERLTFLD